MNLVDFFRLGGFNDYRLNLFNFYSVMVCCLWISCIYCFFFGVNISNVVYLMINLI